MNETYPQSAKLPASAIANANRHFFLCVGPDCCSSEQGEAAWSYLKTASAKMQVPILRSRAACLRVCTGGPWMVVYPEGVWYGAMTPERIQRVLDAHVLRGETVAEWVSVCTASGCADRKND